MSSSADTKGKRVLTIGHSNQDMDKLLDLLLQFHVEAVADVRSHPYSRYAPQFNHDGLRARLSEAGLKYVYLGKELGGRPLEPEFYDSEGFVRYDRLADSPRFREGIGRLLAGIDRYRVALLCSEENPAECHRRVLIGRVLSGLGVTVEHIRGDGTLQTEADLGAAAPGVGQAGLFGDQEVVEWKSTGPVRKENAG